jgi:hypothetical protein
MTATTNNELQIGMTLIGDIVLDVDMEQAQSTDIQGQGPQLGGGPGTISGERLNGKVAWDFYEDIGEAYCTNAIAGHIDTDDGARIDYQTRGYAKVEHPDVDGDSWTMTHSVFYSTDDARYAWINGAQGLWYGEFHMGHYQHNYKAYVATVERTAAA